MTLLELIIGVIAIALVAGLIVLARLASRVGRAADDVGLAARRVAEITPAARTFMEAGRAELEALRALTGTLGAIAGHAQTVTGQAGSITSQLSRGVESGIFDRTRAVIAGVRAGAKVLSWFRRRNGSTPFDHPRTEAYSRAEAFDDLNNQ